MEVATIGGLDAGFVGLEEEWAKVFGETQLLGLVVRRIGEC